VVLLCDPRLGLTELDESLLEIIRPRVEQGLKFLVLLTKADKLTRSEGAKALSIARLQAGGGEAKLFSALKKIGVDETAQLLWQWTHGPEAQELAQTHASKLEPHAGDPDDALPLPPSERGH
jgi:GTP-binding protein